MTTLTDRPNTALLVIDVQNDVVGGAHNREGVIANINTLIDRARIAGSPVIWIQHSDEEMPPGSEGWKYVPELTRGESEPLVHKKWGDSFEETTLEGILAERGVGHVILTGAQSEACIRSTLHGSIVRGYDVTLVGDAHTTVDMTEWGVPTPEVVINFTNLYWKFHAAPGRTSTTLNTADVAL